MAKALTVRFLQIDPSGHEGQIDDVPWITVRALPRVGEHVSIGTTGGDVSRVEWRIERSRMWGASALVLVYLQA
jgi:hypothetical protein